MLIPYSYIFMYVLYKIGLWLALHFLCKNVFGVQKFCLYSYFFCLYLILISLMWFSLACYLLFQGNSVSTTKYNFFTFLPKGLYEQVNLLEFSSSEMGMVVWYFRHFLWTLFLVFFCILASDLTHRVDPEESYVPITISILLMVECVIPK